MSREYGLSIAERAKNSIKNNDLDSVAGYLVRIFDTVGRRPGYAPVVQRSDNGYIIKIEQCPLHFENPELCLAHTTMEATVVKELNAGLSYRIGKSIPCGDAYCEHIVEIK